MKTEVIHRSKIEPFVLIPVALVLGGVTAVMIINMIWIGIVICSVIIFVVSSVYVNTFYKITTDGRLLVKCGILEKFEIDIADIEWIRKSRELSNAPALAFDRLEVGYKGGRVLVSPKDQKQFLSDLRRLNSRIWMAEV
jgi:hypothetical protein